MAAAAEGGGGAGEAKADGSGGGAGGIATPFRQILAERSAEKSLQELAHDPFIMFNLGVGYEPAFSDDPITVTPFTISGAPSTRSLCRLLTKTDCYESLEALQRGLSTNLNLSSPLPQLPVTLGMSYLKNAAHKTRSFYLVISNVFISHRETIPSERGFTPEATTLLGDPDKWFEFGLKYGSQYLAGLDYGRSLNLIIEIQTDDDSLSQSLSVSGGATAAGVSANLSVLKTAMKTNKASMIKLSSQSRGFPEAPPHIVITGAEEEAELTKKWNELEAAVKKYQEDFASLCKRPSTEVKETLPIVYYHYLPYARMNLAALSPAQHADYLKFVAAGELRRAKYHELVSQAAVLKEVIFTLTAYFVGSDLALPLIRGLEDELRTIKANEAHFKLVLFETSSAYLVQLTKTVGEIKDKVVEILQRLRGLRLINLNYPLRITTTDDRALSAKVDTGRCYLVAPAEEVPSVYFCLKNRNGGQFLNIDDSFIWGLEEGDENFGLSRFSGISGSHVYVKLGKEGDSEKESNYWKIRPSGGMRKDAEFSFGSPFLLSSTYGGNDRYLVDTMVKDAFFIARAAVGEARIFGIEMHPDRNFDKDLEQLGAQLGKIFRSHAPGVAISGLGASGSGAFVPPTPPSPGST